MRRDPNTRVCIEPARNGGVYCLTSDDCSKCGWCLKVEARRKATIKTTPPMADPKGLTAQRLRRATNLLEGARQKPTQ